MAKHRAKAWGVEVIAFKVANTAINDETTKSRTVSCWRPVPPAQ